MGRHARPHRCRRRGAAAVADRQPGLGGVRPGWASATPADRGRRARPAAARQRRSLHLRSRGSAGRRSAAVQSQIGSTSRTGRRTAAAAVAAAGGVAGGFAGGGPIYSSGTSAGDGRAGQADADPSCSAAVPVARLGQRGRCRRASRSRVGSGAGRGSQERPSGPSLMKPSRASQQESLSGEHRRGTYCRR